MIDRRRNDLHTIRVLAEWDTLVENEHGHGPLIELELGYRAAAYYLPASSCGSWTVPEVAA